MKTVVIIRGNSGSGKTTTAQLLQRKLGRGTMLLSQDVVRREILWAKENTKHPTAKLLYKMAHFGWNNGYDTVIIEGILSAQSYGGMLKKLIGEAEHAHVYYYGLSFDETLRRHAGKSNADEFGEAEMREWWCDDDRLGVLGEVVIDDDISQDELLDRMVSDRGV